MRVVCIAREESDYAREVREWTHEFKRDTGYEVEMMDPDSVDGEIFTQAHDILQFPTIAVTTNDGVMQQRWGGTPLPQFDDVLYYVRQI